MAIRSKSLLYYDTPPNNLDDSTKGFIIGDIIIVNGLIYVTSNVTIGAAVWDSEIPFTSPLTTKGDLYTRTSSVDGRLGSGSNGTVLVADSTQAIGLKYDTIPNILGYSPVDKAGDTITGNINFISNTGIQNSTTGSTLNIGTNNNTSNINIGTGNGTQVVNIGTGSGQTIINLGGPNDIVNIAGTSFFVDTQNLIVVDKQITLNKNGALTTANNSGILFEEGGNSSAGYILTNNNRDGIGFKTPLSTGILEVKPNDNNFTQTINGGVVTNNQTYTLPDNTGTLALLSDVKNTVVIRLNLLDRLAFTTGIVGLSFVRQLDNRFLYLLTAGNGSLNSDWTLIDTFQIILADFTLGTVSVPIEYITGTFLELAHGTYYIPATYVNTGLYFEDDLAAGRIIAVRALVDTYEHPESAIDTNGVSLYGLFNFGANTTISSPIISGIISTTLFQIGNKVTGIGIPTNSTILSIDSGTQITISANCTLTQTAQLLTVDLWLNGYLTRNGLEGQKSYGLGFMYDCIAENTWTKHSIYLS